MAGALKTAGLPGVRVKGRTDIAFGFKGMGEATAETAIKPVRTTTGSYVDVEKGDRVYSWLVRNEGVASRKWDDTKSAYEPWVWKGKISNKPIFANGWYAKPWEIVGKTESEWNTASGSWKATPEQKAQSVADEMEDWWAYLSDRMKGIGV